MFRFAHATHPNWLAATELICAQLEGQRQLEQFAADPSRPLRIGICYMTEAYATFASAVMDVLRRKTGVKSWVGGVSEAICATGVEYFKEPAIAVMLLELPADSARLFSGRQPLPKPGTLTASGREAMASAMVHVSPSMDDIPGLVSDLATKVRTGAMFGGIVHPSAAVTHLADETFQSGLSGLVLADNAPVEIFLTQGFQTIAADRRITRVSGRFIQEIDHRPAMDVLVEDLHGPANLAAEDLQNEINMSRMVRDIADRYQNGLYVRLIPMPYADKLQQLKYTQGRVQHLPERLRMVLGIDPVQQALVISNDAQLGELIAFATRDEHSIRADLIRLCAEIRESIDAPAPKLSTVISAGFSGIPSGGQGARRPRGAVYIACSGRGAAMFGQQGAELHLIREQLGDIPLVGFFSNGEIYGDELFAMSAVLAIFY